MAQYMEIGYNVTKDFYNTYNIQYSGAINNNAQPHGPGKLYTGPPGSNVFNGYGVLSEIKEANIPLNLNNMNKTISRVITKKEYDAA